MVLSDHSFFAEQYIMDGLNKRKKIAVFTSNIYEAMTSDMQAGINKAAMEEGVKVIYFTSFSDTFSSKIYDQYHKYDEGDTVCFEIADIDDFDGAIKIDSSYGPVAKKKMIEILDNAKIPVINVGGYDDRYRNVLNNEEISFEEIVEHVIVEHGCKDIYHVAGVPSKYFTLSRVKAYRNSLEKHNIGFDEDKIYYGTLWLDCGEPALEHILSHCKSRGKKYPDAIVCANDYSAIGVINACRNHGINVPEDIIVTGYDGVESAFQGYPSVTTSTQPFYRAGYEAVKIFTRLWSGEDVPNNVSIKGELARNQSCGCKPMNTESLQDIREKYLSQMGRISYLSQSTTNLLLGVSSAKTMDDAFEQIGKNAGKDTGFKDMLLCLAPDWNKQRIIDSSFAKKDEEMTVVTGFIGDRNVPKQVFRKKNLLPDDLLNDPNPYYIFPLHHLQYYLGYLIVSPDVGIYDQLAMKSWLVNLGVILENLRIQHELNVTVEHLENLYNRDMLTGLYNRRGYEMFFEEYYEECVRDKKGLVVMLLDMDDLKTINDNLGHSEGDYGLCAISEAMTAAAQDDEICMRTGGDEFVVLAKDYTDEKVEEFKKRLREHMTKRVERDRKRFEVNVSIGYYLEIPDGSSGRSVTEISESFLKKADKVMYEDKKAHKAGREAHT